MESVIMVKCPCGREVALEILLYENQDEYRGDCECGRRWFLKELSEVLAEISDEEGEE